MAGIGFKLRDLLSSSDSTTRFRGLTAALLIVAGPMLFMAFGIISFEGYEDHRSDANAFIGMIVYSYIISWVTIGSLEMIVTRYFSDLIYLQLMTSIPKLLSLLIGGSYIIAVFASGLVCWLLGIEKAYAYSTMMLTGILGAAYAASIFVTATRSYFLVIGAYGAGVLSAILMKEIFATANLTSDFMKIFIWCLGQTVTVAVLIIALQKEFGTWSESPPMLLKYLRSRRRYLYLGVFTALAPCIDRLVFWISPTTAKGLAGGFVAYPLYDKSMFYASLISIPSLAIFLVKVETSFHFAVRDEFNAIERGATYDEIQYKSNHLNKLALTSIHEILAVGLVLAFMAIFSTFIIDSTRGFGKSAFRWGVLGYAFFFPMVFSNIFMLYFSRVREVIRGQSIYLLSCCLLTLATSFMSLRFHGLGFALASGIGFLFTYRLLWWVLKNHTQLSFTDFDDSSDVLPSPLNIESLAVSE